jgi:biopolymer transport protein ExbB
MGFLLQVDSTNLINTAAQQTAQTINLWSLLNKGGWIMYPLYLLLAAAIFVFFERLIAIRKAVADRSELYEHRP